MDCGESSTANQGRMAENSMTKTSADDRKRGRAFKSAAGIGARDGRSVRERFGGTLEIIFAVILAVYPLRHVNWGLDLWDTGYSYANFQYMGTDHMDPMWLFSTYLANAVGHGISMLPGAGSLVGMNLYTGLLVSILALSGFFFCVRVVKMPSWIVFLGEMAALGLCWCPTAKLYDYLTYLLLLYCVVLLYFGLTREKKWYLFGAGVCLGANVLVRFSNVPEAVLILAVWGWDVILWVEAGKEGRRRERGNFWRRLLKHTLWCLLGYLAALAVLLGWIHLRYGIGAYAEGIRQLFAMTDNAVSYRPRTMLADLVYVYVSHLYWVIRLGVITAAGMALGAAAQTVRERLAEAKQNSALFAARALQAGFGAVWGLICVVTLVWLYRRGFFSFRYYSYDSIWHPGVLFLMLTMFTAAVRIFYPGTPREERLLGGMVLLVVFFTSVGSNNNIYPSLNNLFLAAPYTVWQCVRFIRSVSDIQFKKLRISLFPLKGMLAVFLVLCGFQFGMFGAVFMFAEGTGVRNTDSYVENNECLKGIRMSGEKALWMTRISEYVEENRLQGSDVILYGDIPALSYYLGMPAAFNPWCSLQSYRAEQMERAMAEMVEQMRNTEYRPPVIVEDIYIAYWTGGEEALEEMGLSRERIQIVSQDQKWQMLVNFLEEHNYREDLDNGKFTVFR